LFDVHQDFLHFPPMDAGLRHDNLHDPVSGTRQSHLFKDDSGQLPMESEETPALSPLTGHETTARDGRGWGMKRTSSCPGKLKDPASIELVKPEYSRRNHKNFLDIYSLGAVLGTGGYAVVRECTNIATGKKFAAKMMTVSEHPESGGREIAKQVRLHRSIALTLRSSRLVHKLCRVKLLQLIQGGI
jgi:serine/threonine protein kinase